MNTTTTTTTTTVVPDLAEDPAFSDPQFAPRPTETPSPTSAVPATITERRDAWQARVEEAVDHALSGEKDMVAGVRLNPFTGARASLLRKTGNEFVSGVKLSQIEDPFIAVGRFLVLMSRPLDESRSLAAKDAGEALDDAAYALLDTVQIADMSIVVSQVNAYVQREMDGEVHGSLPDDRKSSAPGN